jgi:hypothetical protein
MDPERRRMVGILGGLLATALPQVASAQKITPNTPMRPPTVRPPSPTIAPITVSPVRIPLSSPRDPALTGQEGVSALLGPRATSRFEAVELADGRLVLIENGRPFVLGLQGAPDGSYDLSRSGTILVQGGRAAGVSGQPVGVMAPVALP